MSEGCVLPGYEAQWGENGLDHSQQKLKNALEDLKPLVECNIEMKPCETEWDTWAYRCSCSFQVVREGGEFHYAMRQNRQPILLKSSAFPIANKRIQMVMDGLLQRLYNNAHDDVDAGGPGRNSQTTCVISRHLASVSFATSWKDSSDADCFVTLNYGEAVDEDTWRLQAQAVVDELSLTKLNGRSKKRHFAVYGAEERRDSIQDTIYLLRLPGPRVSLIRPAEDSAIMVQYQKPEGAFFHPNARAMLTALQWMLNRLESIVKEQPDCSLLEMYCGCGAHTVALARSGLLRSIMAVELDRRLVQACVCNCQLNGCYGDEATPGTTPVRVFEGDAGSWARKSLRQDSSKNQKSNSHEHHHLHVLLVDPPRMGLDENVCRMAIEGGFHHVIYISCGRVALLRDLALLQSHFTVAHCALLDLFPRTDAVESLVHLVRR